MYCNKFEDYLNEKLDLDTLKSHMDFCDRCRKAYQIESKLISQSKRLNDNIKVPDLWPAIEEKIKQEIPRIIKFRSTKRLLFAAAATFLIVATIWLFNSHYMEKPSARILSEQALEKVKKAEAVYIDAIANLEKLAYNRLDNTSEPLAQLYRNKLSLIDRQIENCQNALESNPANSHIRQYLMTALQDKQKTLEDILRLIS
jgi:hypothetical protein